MYVNAEKVLPRDLVHQIQRYVQGKEIYIPKKSEGYLSWGERNGTKVQLEARNREILSHYVNGESVEALMELFHLSYDSIRRIIREGKLNTMSKG